MKIYSVYDKVFKEYGAIVEGYDTVQLLEKLNQNSEKPKNSVIYVPSAPFLESTLVAKKLTANLFGGQDIQIGYCNGTNTTLNCYEYHRDSEVNVSSDDFILLLAHRSEIVEGKLDTSVTKAFKVPAGVMVEVFATSLHYAPCSAKKGDGFRVVIILPKGTNYPNLSITPCNREDKMLFAKNKWLLAHPDASEVEDGAYIGLMGENIDITTII